MDYEKKYNEALERAKKFHKKELYAESNGNLVEYIFPELAESEDERIRKWLIQDIQQAIIDDDYNDVSIEDAKKALSWLEKQKPVEWSEEDERILGAIKEMAYTISASDKQFLERHGTNSQELKNFAISYKSLRPQKHWKPSEEQMRVLALSFSGIYKEEDIKVLRTLFEDLKKL